MTERLNLLIVEDSPSDAKLLVLELRRTWQAIDFERVDTGGAMRSALERKPWDLVLSDSSMPTFSARAALAILQENGLDIPFIVVSGTIGEENAVEAMRAGARDFVLKGQLARLTPAVERELRDRKVREAKRLAERNELRLEQQLRQLQKMEAVGRLAGGVAHDFNNVLSVILGYAGQLLEDMKPDEPMRDDIEEIRKAGERAAALTRQLLTFSRQQVLESKVLDLNEALGKMDQMLQHVVGADVALVWLLEQALGRVRVDPASVEQVVMNLVVNARDAMPTGGTLTLETRNVALDEAYAREHLGVVPGPHVLLAVSDTGTGIDSATLTRIFEPFFTTKAVGKGTGLGLSTVFGIVQRSGGSVRVQSQPGVGTTFKVYLPRVEAPIDAARASKRPTTLRGCEMILLVEDDDQVRAVVRGILRKSGYSVLEARNGAEALELSEKHSGTIQLLVSDVVMPQMSGPELAKRLAQTRPNIKVLCMSGYTDDSIVRHGVLEAQIAYLQKPISREALTTKVREVLDASKGLEPPALERP